MAQEIRKICFGKYKVLQINPAKYNELYGKMKNLNVLLAWAHAAVIEELLEKQDVKLAIADKFGDEKYINDKLKTKGKGIHLIQVPKAEQNIAVTAASILARDALLKWSSIAKMTYGLTLPKGASSTVTQAGRAYVKVHDKGDLFNVAKLHFKTTEGRSPLKAISANPILTKVPREVIFRGIFCDMRFDQSDRAKPREMKEA
jgi:ribonuclease HIII